MRPRPTQAGSKKARAGRPTRFTPQLGARMVALVGAGALFKDAARACGVAEATAYEWLARGEGRDLARPPTSELTAWAQEMRLAQAVPMVVASTWLFDHKRDVWLARRDPSSWGPGGHASHEPTEGSAAPPGPVDGGDGR